MYERLDDEEVSLARDSPGTTCIHPRFLFVDVDEDEDIAKCGRARVMPSEQHVRVALIDIDTGPTSAAAFRDGWLL